MALEVAPLLPRGLADFPFRERYEREWQALGFSPSGHPCLFLQERMAAVGAPCADLQNGEQVTLAGLVLRPHRPQAANGTLFFTLEDETGMAHVTALPAVYGRCGADIYGQAVLAVRGTAERRGAGVSLLAQGTAPL